MFHYLFGRPAEDPFALMVPEDTVPLFIEPVDHDRGMTEQSLDQCQYVVSPFVRPRGCLERFEAIGKASERVMSGRRIGTHIHIRQPTE
ncbi:hypothetical protein [Halomonas sp. B23F22_10]|uniref:hypothetical protein n=1 Tax=Halomonas sp. B23F22_10 TaxID=3459515 RepID=UPI00373E8F1E